MRRSIALLTMLLMGCAPADQPADDAATAAATMAPTLSLADVAGVWSVRALTEAGDSTLTTYEMNATAEPTGWTMVLEGRPPIPITVTVDGDSILARAGPFESVLRPGVTVSTQSVIRHRDGMLVGSSVARYTTTAADSVVRIRLEGTRIR